MAITQSFMLIFADNTPRGKILAARDRIEKLYKLQSTLIEQLLKA